VVQAVLHIYQSIVSRAIQCHVADYNYQGIIYHTLHTYTATATSSSITFCLVSQSLTNCAILFLRAGCHNNWNDRKRRIVLEKVGVVLK